MSDLVGNPEDRFSHNEAQIISYDYVFISYESRIGSNKNEIKKVSRYNEKVSSTVRV